MSRTVAVFAFALLALAVCGHAQQEVVVLDDQPTELESLTWNVPADIIFPLPQLLEQGFLPVQQKGREGKPAVSLVRLGDGAVLWTANIGEDPAAVNANDTMLFVATRERVLGLALATGEAVWTAPVEGMLDSGWQHDPRFAQSQWFADLRTPGQGIGGVLLCHGDKLYVTSGGSIWALNAATGEDVWASKYGFKLNFPLVACGDVIVASSDLGLGGYNASTGEVVWEAPEARQAGPLFIVDEGLYAAMPQALVRMDPGNGAEVWSAAIQQDKAMAVQTVGECLVVRRASDVWVLDANDGRRLWAAETGHQQSVIGGKNVFVHSAKGGDIYCFSLKDMKYTWHAPFPDSGVARLFYGANILVGISGFDVVAYSPTDGKQLWHRKAPPGLLFDTNTWGANRNSIFFKTANQLAGCGSAEGKWTAAVEGEFFFVHWIWTNDVAMFAHCQHPGGASVRGLIIKQPQQ